MGFFDRFFRRTLSNSKLDRYMTAAARPGASPQTLQELYRALLSSRLILATPGLSASQTPMDDGAKVRFVSTTAPQGESAMLLFSSDAALRAWRPSGCDTLIAPAKELFGMAIRSGLNAVVINPRGPAGGVIDKRALAAIAEGRVPPLDEKDPFRVTEGNMVLDLPRTPPRGPLVEAVRAECKHAADIRAAYFLEASIEAGASHLLLALELSDGAPAQDIARRLMESVKLVLGTSEYIDVMPMAAGSEQSKRLAKLAPPFFNRDSPAR